MSNKKETSHPAVTNDWGRWFEVDDPDTWETMGRFYVWVTYSGVWHLVFGDDDQVEHGPYDSRAAACEHAVRVICGPETK